MPPAPVTSARTMSSTAAPVAVIDLLTSLLEAELNSVFRFIAEGSPYLSRATAEVRRPLQEMTVSTHRRAGQLADLIDALGSVPTPQAAIRADEQYLAYLSLKFLLPKLVDEKKLCIQRYENGADTVARFPAVPPEVPALLQSHLAEQRHELSALEHAAAQVAPAKNGTAKKGGAKEDAAKKDPSQPAPGTRKNSDAGPAAG